MPASHTCSQPKRGGVTHTLSLSEAGSHTHSDFPRLTISVSYCIMFSHLPIINKNYPLHFTTKRFEHKTRQISFTVNSYTIKFLSLKFCWSIPSLATTSSGEESHVSSAEFCVGRSNPLPYVQIDYNYSMTEDR